MKSIAILSHDVGLRKSLDEELLAIYGREIEVIPVQNIAALLETMSQREINLVVTSYFDANMNAIVNFAPYLEKERPGMKVVVFHDRSDARFDVKCAKLQDKGFYPICLEKNDLAGIVAAVKEQIARL